MADDGGWLNEAGLRQVGVGDDGRATRDRFLDVLSEFGQRLTSPQPMRRDTAIALVQQLDRLARRMASKGAASHARAADLDIALDALKARLESETTAHAARDAQLTRQVDTLVTELAQVRASKRPLVDGQAVRTILAAAAACAALCVAGWGVMTLTRPRTPEASPPAMPVEVAAEPAIGADAPPIVAAEAVAEPTPAEPVIPPITKAEPVAAPARETYAVVADAVTRGDAVAVARLTRLAQAGDAQAQLRLATLYENATAGLPRDLAAARLWTQRAAKGGDRAAMYNLGLFLLEGDGGPQDLRTAATWFRRAAERGVVDAQYNLGMMYEVGRGVRADPREALRWYGLAAAAGDADGRQKQGELERRLRGGPAAKPDTVASTDKPQAAMAEVGTTEAAQPPASVADTQAFLARQGYYIGPIDGVASPAVKAAAAAYLAERPIARANPER